MAARWASELVVVVTAAAVSTVGVLLHDGSGLPELAFGTIVLALLVSLVRATIGAHRAAERQRRVTAELLERRPDAVAAEAVAVERSRISHDIEASVRAALLTVAVMVEQAQREPDPRRHLQGIQAQARRAGAELRRQLDLLHDDPGDAAPRPREPVGPTSGLRRADVWTALGVCAAAVVEAVLWTRLEGSAVSPFAVVLTGLAGVVVIGRRIAPRRTALLLCALLLLGTVTGSHVQDGLWMVLAVGLVAWPLATAPDRRSGGCLVALAGALAVSRWLFTPDNLGVNVVGLVVATTAGWWAGRSERARRREVTASDAHSRVLTDAARVAVQGERSALARELHDLGSHAVAVVSVQAAAAEMTWTTDPAVAVEALRIVRTTTLDVLAELDRVGPRSATPAREWADVERLVERLRSAGLAVGLEVDRVPTGCVPTAYRVVQECLTNVLRHSPGATATVHVTHADDRVTIEVSDRGGRVGPPAPGTRRYGLVGLRDRVTEAGGTFSAGPRGAGGFRVRVTLPHRAPVELA